MLKPKFTIQKTLDVNTSKEGEPLEIKVMRATTNKQPLDNSAPLLYTERKQGILASTNIRTDRFEVAIDAMDKISKSYMARRENKPVKDKSDDGEPKSIQGKQEPVPEVK